MIKHRDLTRNTSKPESKENEQILVAQKLFKIRFKIYNMVNIEKLTLCDVNLELFFLVLIQLTLHFRLCQQLAPTSLS